MYGWRGGVLCLVSQILAPYIAASDNIIQNVLVLQLFLTMFSGLLLHLHQPDETLISSVEDTVVQFLGYVARLYMSSSLW